MYTISVHEYTRATISVRRGAMLKSELKLKIFCYVLFINIQMYTSTHVANKEKFAHTSSAISIFKCNRLIFFPVICDKQWSVQHLSNSKKTMLVTTFNLHYSYKFAHNYVYDVMSMNYMYSYKIFTYISEFAICTLINQFKIQSRLKCSQS